MAFDVVREWVTPFPCYRKDNYIVKYLKLTEPLFSNCPKILNIQVNLVITRMSGCINPDRVINEARYSFENGLTSPAIAVVGGVHVISHAYGEFSDKNYCV